MEGADAEKANHILLRAREPNAIQALVEAQNLHTRNAQRWYRLGAEHLNDFPVLTVEYSRKI